MPGNIGANIKKFREKAGLSQAELGERIGGVHFTTISRWELDIFQPKASDIKKLCEVLHCTEAELLSDTATAQRFELVLDPKGEMVMEVRNDMSTTAMEQKTMTVSPQRIAVNMNINTAGLKKAEARELFLATFDEIFNDAWNQQQKWRKREA